jgi:hypothetical protein
MKKMLLLVCMVMLCVGCSSKPAPKSYNDMTPQEKAAVAKGYMADKELQRQIHNDPEMKKAKSLVEWSDRLVERQTGFKLR